MVEDFTGMPMSRGKKHDEHDDTVDALFADDSFDFSESKGTVAQPLARQKSTPSHAVARRNAANGDERGMLTSTLWTLFSFQGRIPRSVYWTVLFALLPVPLLAVIVINVKTSQLVDVAVVALIAVYVWIGLAVEVKRWHDRGKSGWWVLLRLVPLIGPIWIIVEMGFLRGTVGWNDYGPDPTGSQQTR